MNYKKKIILLLTIINLIMIMILIGNKYNLDKFQSGNIQSCRDFSVNLGPLRQELVVNSQDRIMSDIQYNCDNIHLILIISDDEGCENSETCKRIYNEHFKDDKENFQSQLNIIFDMGGNEYLDRLKVQRQGLTFSSDINLLKSEEIAPIIIYKNKNSNEFKFKDFIDLGEIHFRNIKNASEATAFLNNVKEELSKEELTTCNINF
jgi:hypothetical protein